VSERAREAGARPRRDSDLCVGADGGEFDLRLLVELLHAQLRLGLQLEDLGLVHLLRRRDLPLRLGLDGPARDARAGRAGVRVALAVAAEGASEGANLSFLVSAAWSCSARVCRSWRSSRSFCAS
jgi:hypothetical protein